MLADGVSAKPCKKCVEGRNLSSGIAEGSEPLTAFPTVVPFFQAAEKCFPKLNFVIAALGLLSMKVVAS